LRQVCTSAWFAYTTILLLQCKSIWGMWNFRDLTNGDTQMYFVQARDWLTRGTCLITWSPLYTSFWGTLMRLAGSNDAYTLTILHRVVMALILSVLVLAVMRRLLPPELAWLAAAWWAPLPIGFNTFYEVHLFAVIPLMLVFLAILWRPGPWGRGAGAAILLATALLMRNEFLLASALFYGLCFCWEVWRARRGERLTARTVLAYVLPLATVFLLTGFYYRRAEDAGSIQGMLQVKHTLNVCQVYAFGYQQRHPEWRLDPWTECHQLMTAVYGAPEPSLNEALRRNPRAIAVHVAWNLELIPNGLEVLLFNGMSGSVDPDYAPVSHSSIALPLGLLSLTIVCAAVFVVIRQRQYWWKTWFADRIWVWISMGCMGVVAVVVMLTQRPRPSYLLAFGIALRAAVAMGVLVLVHVFPAVRGWLARQRLTDFLFPAAVLLVFALTSSPYGLPASPRPLLESYRILQPFREWLDAPDAELVTPAFSGELCSYLSRTGTCRPLRFSDLRRQVTPQTPLNQVLVDNRATIFLADSTVLGDAVVHRFIAQANSLGWRVIGSRHDPYGSWDLLVRFAKHAAILPGEPAPLAQNAQDIADPLDGLVLGAGWHGFERVDGVGFRWANNDAEIFVTIPGAGPSTLAFIAERGPSFIENKPVLQIFGEDRLLQTVAIGDPRIIKVQLPANHMIIRLHAAGSTKPLANDARILNFRVFHVWVE
jgi:hypothetical protein